MFLPDHSNDKIFCFPIHLGDQICRLALLMLNPLSPAGMFCQVPSRLTRRLDRDTDH
jgi:hypothetical protein